MPKESKTYTNTLRNFAIIDNKLASSQLEIGSASNVAGITLSYSYTYNDPKYLDYISILATLAQISIDSAKRASAVDVTSEIKRIKSELDMKTNGYPAFWRCIRPGFKGYINNKLRCPMNEVASFKAQKPHHHSHPIPNQEFFHKHELTESRRKCKRVENLIEKYSLELLEAKKSDEDEYEEYILLRNDFDQLLQDIRRTYISNNYLGLMSWLIDRALLITPDVVRTVDQMQSTLHKNRSLLLKVLYDVSPNQFMQCFVQKSEQCGDFDRRKPA